MVDQASQGSFVRVENEGCFEGGRILIREVNADVTGISERKWCGIFDNAQVLWDGAWRGYCGPGFVRLPVISTLAQWSLIFSNVYITDISYIRRTVSKRWCRGEKATTNHDGSGRWGVRDDGPLHVMFDFVDLEGTA